ncbi:zinc ABC transporter substrate-binding protein [Rubellimicrobium roseum]|uniref:High-affinity zinc uptake system protein ZnuA n=1 Tax=Rubellimicrobium roseum TaxID=687525 RepID=A0A5C4NNJ8_9RHOB|nr:zinc ABC transporter substrate-binding protein [Rubellimicrobium roseum]TNC74636.1 hypothetical protein FHG71_00400 [Rubellimicrobium roseum]
MTRLTAALVLLAAPASAEVPSVLADTAPLHSLVSMVMGDLGPPTLIVPPGTSPHDASLSPSEARALTEADLILWTGDALLPWLGDSIDSLAPQATVVSLLESEGWEPLLLDAGAHHDHADEHDHAHEHAAEGIDPHAWLDPAVAAAWTGTIAEALAGQDPENAATYRANAEAAAQRLDALRADLSTRFAPHAGTSVAVGHDAYRYLERALGLGPSRAISAADGAAAAPSAVTALRDAVLAGELRCLLVDAETDPAWAGTLGEGADLRTASVDPDGVNLEPGPDLYPALMDGLSREIEACLAP